MARYAQKRQEQEKLGAQLRGGQTPDPQGRYQWIGGESGTDIVMTTTPVAPKGFKAYTPGTAVGSQIARTDEPKVPPVPSIWDTSKGANPRRPDESMDDYIHRAAIEGRARGDFFNGPSRAPVVQGASTSTDQRKAELRAKLKDGTSTPEEEAEFETLIKGK